MISVKKDSENCLKLSTFLKNNIGDLSNFIFICFLEVSFLNKVYVMFNYDR